MKNPHRQCVLKCGDVRLVANLPDVKGLKTGNSVTLKDHPEPDRQWEIVSVSPVVRDRTEIKQKWHNNI